MTWQWIPSFAVLVMREVTMWMCKDFIEILFSFKWQKYLCEEFLGEEVEVGLKNACHLPFIQNKIKLIMIKVKFEQRLDFRWTDGPLGWKAKCLQGVSESSLLDFSYSPDYKLLGFLPSRCCSIYSIHVSKHPIFQKHEKPRGRIIQNKSWFFFLNKRAH